MIIQTYTFRTFWEVVNVVKREGPHKPQNVEVILSNNVRDPDLWTLYYFSPNGVCVKISGNERGPDEAEINKQGGTLIKLNGHMDVWVR